MQNALFFILLLTFSDNLYSQETRYIRDTLYVSLRNEPSANADIIQSRLVSGTMLTLIEESGDKSYSLVKMTNGNEGWLPSRYLRETPIAKQQLEQITQELMLMTRERTLLIDKLALLETKFAEATNLPEQLTGAVNQPDSTDIQKDVSLAESKQALLLENQRLNNRLQVATIENDSLQHKIEYNNFLNGAFAVLFGVIITLLIPRLRPAKHSEWK